MAQYLLAVHVDYDDTSISEEAMTQTYAAVEAYNQTVQEAGAWVFGGGLLPPSAAKVVRPTGAETLLVDGPYTETKESLGGFWIIDVEDDETALAWARKAAIACAGPVEVRPFEADAG